MPRPTTLERAFEMARTGKYAGVGEIRDALMAEGYATAQVVGPSLQRQLRELCQKAGGTESRQARPGRPRRALTSSA